MKHNLRIIIAMLVIILFLTIHCLNVLSNSSPLPVNEPILMFHRLENKINFSLYKQKERGLKLHKLERIYISNKKFNNFINFIYSIIKNKVK